MEKYGDKDVVLLDVFVDMLICFKAEPGFFFRSRNGQLSVSLMGFGMGFGMATWFPIGHKVDSTKNIWDC